MRDTSASPSPNLKAVTRPPQPVPLPAWKLVDDPVKYRYDWLGKARVVERIAETADPRSPKQYSYIHLLPAHGKVFDGKLDHWVPTARLAAVGDGGEGKRAPPLKPQVRRVDHVVFGGLHIPAWYNSGFPAVLNSELLQNGGRVYVCPVCLKYTTRAAAYAQHMQTTCGGDARFKGLKHPPGCEIFRRDDWSIWEVDGGESDEEEREGAAAKQWEAVVPREHLCLHLTEALYRERYCHSLCLLARLFLDTKLNRYGSGPFRFFVLTQRAGDRHMFRGMFSREKGHSNNLSCIVTLPPWQKCGWGKRLIHISYLLSRIEATSGQPEKPLSALGKRVYERYHNEQVLTYLQHRLKHRAGRVETRGVVADVVAATGIERDDVLAALQRLQLAPPSRPDEVDWTVVHAKDLGAHGGGGGALAADQPRLYHISYEELTGDRCVDL
eukprot:TRINITY_DN25748_c0_g1_i1.p1 TRINITY_DN25748_c0_g1~~TRINITY_DN25748_c0_g1_i1.p1  ORF type:complete len:440 (+),score=159.93 TRINITY_DN25748_c0_g1_i1:191-1510(+)